MNDNLKIARINAKTEQLNAAKGLALAIIDNPVVDLLAGTLAIEYWAKQNDAGGWWGETLELGTKTAMLTALNFVCVAKALGGGEGVANIVGKLADRIPMP